MFANVYDKIKTISSNINKLEDKLLNTAFLPMVEQNKIHAEIRKLKEEMELLERRTRK